MNIRYYRELLVQLVQQLFALKQSFGSSKIIKTNKQFDALPNGETNGYKTQHSVEELSSESQSQRLRETLQSTVLWI